MFLRIVLLHALTFLYAITTNITIQRHLTPIRLYVPVISYLLQVCMEGHWYCLLKKTTIFFQCIQQSFNGMLNATYFFHNFCSVANILSKIWLIGFLLEKTEDLAIGLFTVYLFCSLVDYSCDTSHSFLICITMIYNEIVVTAKQLYFIKNLTDNVCVYIYDISKMFVYRYFHKMSLFENCYYKALN